MRVSTGIALKDGKQIDIAGDEKCVKAIKALSRFGLITFSKAIKFKSTDYVIHFFKPTQELHRIGLM